jgi:hypothetical protein
MTEKIYSMRPHHINLLLKLRLENIGVEEMPQYIRREMNEYSLLCEKDNAEADLKEQGRPIEYSEQFVDACVSFFTKLRSPNEVLIKVAGGLDEICGLGCNRKIGRCEKESDELLEWIRKYNLDVESVLVFKN